MLLVTAAWGEREYQEAHVKEALGAIGLPAALDAGGYDVARQNLGLYHATQGFFRQRPEITARWESKERAARAARAFYLEATRASVARFRRALARAKRHAPGLTVATLLDARSRELISGGDEESLLRRCLMDELAAGLDELRAGDARLLAALERMDSAFERETGLRFDPAWREARSMLEERLLSAAGIFLFGGDPQKLADGITLFDLGPVFAEALRRGAGLYTVSAGSLVLCEKIIVYHQHEGSEFELLDRGMGLVRGIQLFPHCMERVQTDDPDNLAYLAYRFDDHACAGLNEGSFLLLEWNENGTPRARSVGQRDGVYVFRRDGQKMRHDAGQEIPLMDRELLR